MGKWLLIFGLFISVVALVALGCAGAPDDATNDSSSGDAKLGGGSLHIDSFKAPSGVTGTSSRFGTTDTPKNTFSSPATADSLNKKKQ